MAQSMKLCVQQGIDLHDYYEPGNALIAVARNDLVAAALKAQVDDLIMVDADQDWKPEWVPQLLAYPVDCVGAPVRKKSDEIERYNVKAPGAYSFTRHPNHEIWTAPGLALGTGFIRFSRRALQLLWDHSEPYTFGNGPEARLIFDARPMNMGKAIKEMISEDSMVSMKLAKLGIDTWLDPNMNPGHVGLKRWEGNFPVWIERLKAERAP